MAYVKHLALIASFNNSTSWVLEGLHKKQRLYIQGGHWTGNLSKKGKVKQDRC